MLDQTTPEIQRSNLTSTVLTLLLLGIKDVINFSFVEPPHKVSMLAALRQLYLLHAVSKSGAPKPLASDLGKISLEPAYAKCLIYSRSYNCEEEMAILLGILSAENLWVSFSREDTRNSKLE
jgi:HrpA-like RNA helicase